MRLRRDPEPEAAVAVVLGDLAPPLVERERRIGDHPVEQHAARRPRRSFGSRIVSPFSIFARPASPCRSMFILQMAHVPRFFSCPKSERFLRVLPVPLQVVRALDQHAARAAGRVADAHPLLGSSSSTISSHHHPRRVELAALLAGVVGELLDQVLVGAPEHVRLGEVRVAEVDLREVLHQPGEHDVAVAWRRRACARRCSRCPASTPSSAGVLLFQRGARLVERVAEVRGDLLDLRPARPLRDEELVLVGVLGVVAALDQGLALLVEAVRQALQEEQAEDEVLVVGGVDRTAQDVRRRPEVAFEAVDGEALAGREVDLVRRGAAAARGTPLVLWGRRWPSPLRRARPSGGRRGPPSPCRHRRDPSARHSSLRRSRGRSARISARLAFFEEATASTSWSFTRRSATASSN